jgi:hypothetical protein
MKGKRVTKKETIHVCDITGTGQSRKMKALTREPQYMCFTCNRSAHQRENLCNPVSIYELTGGV